jgi:nucleoside-specific outer membrane channel protein Tsx
MKRFIMAAAGLLLAALPAHADFSDNSVSLTYGPTYREPSIQASIPKYIVTFQHFDAGKWGTNFINIDALFSDGHDPSKGSTGGAVEVYALYRGNLSGNAVLGGTPFTFGPVKDIRLELGGDFNTKNDFFAPAKKLIVAGPNIAFNVPGYLNVGLHLAHEWNHNGIPGAKQSEVSFDPTFEMEIVWMQPLNFTGLPLKFDGFFNLVAPKGKDGFGNQTATEILTQPRLVLDIGDVIMKKPNFLDAYVGYQYWLNKFGNDSAIQHNGAIAQTVFVGASVHF